ncbi:MAG: anti-sigma factor [Alphaproteobacteria bacterium]|nr:anti-sigma factor [Alphaproteobacteria bacterium]
MNAPERPIAEEDLHAYVDDQLDPASRAAVARYLEQHPAVAERVAAYAAQAERLRAAFAARASEPIPPALNLSRLLEQRLAGRRHAWRLAASVALALGIGAGSGWVIRAATEPQQFSGIAALEHEAVANHLVYAADRRRPTELGAAQRDDLAQWVSSRLQHPVAPPDLTMLGYRFMGGRLVATMHGAAALFLYDNDRGARLSIFVRPMRDSEATPILVLDIGDVDGCAWVDRGIGYTLIADEPYRELQRMSEYVRKQIAGRT